MKKSYLTPDDLTKDVIEKLKDRNPNLEDILKEATKKPKQYNFTKDDVRKHAIKVLNQISQLTYSERNRVLTHARKMNDVI